MYEIVKNVINAKNYELTDMLIKIDTLWVQGSLMEQQRTELISLARQNADPAASYAPLQDQIDALADRLDALTTRVSALEQSGGDEPGTTGARVAGVRPAHRRSRRLLQR